MTNIAALKEAIKESGMTVSAVAEKSGILRATLYNRFQTPDFRLSEINALSKTLRLTKRDRDRIFFAKKCE